MQARVILPLLLLMSIISAGAILLQQQWITDEISEGQNTGTVPMARIRSDCHNAPELLTAQGAPIAEGYVIDVEVVTPAEYSDCTPSNEAFTTNILMGLSIQIIDCYKRKDCPSITWSPQDLSYQCLDSSKTAQLASNMKLKFETYCNAPDDLSITNIQSNSQVIRTLETCADSNSKSVTHSFLLNPCPKTLDMTEENSELTRLTDNLNKCLGECLSVDISGYNFGEINCALGNQGYTAVGLYWGCDSITPAEPSSPTEPVVHSKEPSTTPNTHEQSAAGTGSSVMNTWQPHTAEAVHRDESRDVEERETSGGVDDNKYLTALIIVSVLLLLVVLLLVGVIIYFLTSRARNRRKYRPVSETSILPSKQALYNRMSASSSSPSCVQGGTRYVPTVSTQGTKATDHSIPMDEEDNYEMADDTYEMVDTPLKASDDKSVPREEINEYATPCMYTTQHPQSRTDSVKYSEGYLLPAVSKQT